MINHIYYEINEELVYEIHGKLVGTRESMSVVPHSTPTRKYKRYVSHYPGAAWDMLVNWLHCDVMTSCHMEETL